MALATLPIDGLVAGKNALVAWHPRLSFDAPLLIVLFFHGHEKEPQAYAWTGHRLPNQLAGSGKNAVLVAPTMRVNGNVIVDYLSSPDGLAKLLREGVAAVAKATHKVADHAFDDAKLLLVGYSNGYHAWNRAVETLQSAPAAVPPAVGHSLFDCLYWACLLMAGVKGKPIDEADFSTDATAIVDSGFVTTHFTKDGATLDQAKFLEAIVARHAPVMTLHHDVPPKLDAKDVVVTHLPPADDHFKAVVSRNELGRVIKAVRGFDLPPGAVA